METAKTVDCSASEAKKVPMMVVMAGTGVAVATFAVRPSLTTNACGTCVKNVRK